MFVIDTKDVDQSVHVRKQASTLKTKTSSAGEHLQFLAACPGLPYLLGQLSKNKELDQKPLRESLGQIPLLLNHCLTDLQQFCGAFTMIRNVEEQGLGDSEFVALGPGPSAVLRAPIEMFLIHSVLLQNAWTKLLALHNTNKAVMVPTSLRKTLKQVADPTHPLHSAFPDLVSQPLQHYWQSNGLKLRHYRDYVVHTATGVSDARAFKADGGEFCVFLILPTNPECKSATKVTWEPPYVHAFPYCWQQFRQLVHVSNHLVVTLLEPNAKERTRIISMMNARPPSKLGHGVLEGICDPAALFQDDLKAISHEIRPFNYPEPAKEPPKGQT